MVQDPKRIVPIRKNLEKATSYLLFPECLKLHHSSRENHGQLGTEPSIKRSRIYLTGLQARGAAR